MNTDFDQHAINHATAALGLVMTPRGKKRPAEAAILFIGGIRPTEGDLTALAEFGLRKNYNLVYASFDPANMSTGPVSLYAVVTDGETAAAVLEGGRLWKADRHSPAILLFPEANALLKVSAKGLVVQQASGRFHDRGFDLAREALFARSAEEPGLVPVLSNIGDFAVVFDSRAVEEALKAA